MFLLGYAGYAITAFQFLIIASSYSQEANLETCAAYSKMAKKSPNKMIPSQIGMLYIYLPSFLLCSVCLMGMIPNVQMTPASILTWIHFAKRVLEVLFLHKYSGKVEENLSRAIGVFYSLVSFLICCVAKNNASLASATLGYVFFFIGITGNFYHHYLLANLRRPQQQSKEQEQRRYVAPRDGLFDYVAAPHYLFELIGWLGIVMVAQQGNAFLVFGGMSSYLSGRSVSQNRWNREKFDEKEWPRTRKNLIPGIF